MQNQNHYVTFFNLLGYKSNNIIYTSVTIPTISLSLYTKKWRDSHLCSFFFEVKSHLCSESNKFTFFIKIKNLTWTRVTLCSLPTKSDTYIYIQ